MIRMIKDFFVVPLVGLFKIVERVSFGGWFTVWYLLMADHGSMFQKNLEYVDLLLMEEILHQLIGWLFHE